MHNRRFQVLSSVYGRIDEVLFVDPDGNRTQEQIAAEYEAVYKNFAPHVKFFIVALHSGEGRKAAELYQSVLERIRGGDGSNRTTVILYGSDPKKNDISIHRFIQDNCMVLESEPGIRAVLATVPSRSITMEGDRRYLQTKVLHAFAAETDYLIKPFPYIIRGSDYLVGDNYMFVSESVFAKNRELLDDVFGEVLVVEHQPRTTDANAAGAADAGAAHSLDGEERNGVEKVKQTKKREILEEALRCGFGVEQIIWVPQPRLSDGSCLFIDLDEILNLGGRIYDASSNKYKELVFLACPCPYAMSGDQDEAERLLQNLQKGFKVIRDYLVSHQTRGLEFNVVDMPIVVDLDPKQRDRNSGFKYHSFNNCQIEVYQSFRNVYLPRFSFDCKIPDKEKHLKAVEERVHAIYKSYGFAPTWINGNFFEYSENRRASLHCITKVLRRSCVARHWNVPYGHKTLRFSQDKLEINRSFAPLNMDRLKQQLAASDAAAPISPQSVENNSRSDSGDKQASPDRINPEHVQHVRLQNECVPPA